MPEAQLQPVLDAYTTETGQRVHAEYGDATTLIERMADKRRTPPADLFIASNVVDLSTVADRDLFRPTRSGVLDVNTRPPWRDPEHLWYGLTLRARVFVYRSEAVEPELVARLTGYEALSEDHWRGRVCLSSSSVHGNRSLIAMLISTLGSRDAEILVRGWRANFAIQPLPDDAQLLQALVQGRCELALAPSNLASRAARGNTAIGVQWPLAKRQVHVDVSGAGVTRHAANPEQAQSLLEWLASDTANALLAALALDYPANPSAATDRQLPRFPAESAYPGNLAGLGYLAEDARLLAERARYP